MKFGGTSVANLDRIRNAAERVRLEVAKGYDVIVIVSAMSGKTNELVGWVNDTFGALRRKRI
jgi:aspartate kinase